MPRPRGRDGGEERGRGSCGRPPARWSVGQDALFRQFDVTPQGGQSVDEVRTTLGGLGSVYVPESVVPSGDGLRVTFSAVAPTGVLSN